MRKSNFIAALLFCLLAPFESVRADIDVHFLGVGTYATLQDSTAATAATPKLALGYALEFSAPIVPRYYVVTSATLLTRKYSDSSGDISRQSIQIPLLIEYHLVRGLKLGLGGYYDLALSSAPSGQRAESYGATSGFELDLPWIPGVGFLIQGRYSMQLSNLSTVDGQTIKFNDLTGLVGFRLGFGR
jgi:hypothetical protein